MKKSKFANINFESVEVLSREQMSKVKGGYGEGAGATNRMYDCAMADSNGYVITTELVGAFTMSDALSTARTICSGIPGCRQWSCYTM